MTEIVHRYSPPNAVLAELNDILYAVHGDHLWQVDTETGNKDAVNTDGWIDMVAMAGHQGLLYAASRSGHLFAYNPKDKNRMEPQKIGGFPWTVSALVTSKSNRHLIVVPWKKDVYLVDPKQPDEPELYRSIPHKHTSAAITYHNVHFYASIIFGASSSSRILQFSSRSDGAEEKTINYKIDSMTTHGQHIYAITSGGKLYRISPSDFDNPEPVGTEIWLRPR